MKKIFNKKQINNAGFTLTEMLVSFVLLAIFLTAATRVIMYTVTLYHQAKGASYGLEVANMVSDKICGMIEGATVIDGGIEPTIAVSEGCSTIHFTDATGSEVIISNKTMFGDSKYINIYYEGVRNEDDTAYITEPTNWYFSKETYMGFSVSGFDLQVPGGAYDDNVIRMKLTLTSPKYGDYSTTRYIRCVNVEAVH